jgi:hypothetical protein
MPLEPDAVHRLGREHLRQVQDDRMALARRLGHADPAEAVATLEDRPGGRLASREEILALARDQVARSWDALPGWFGRLPARNCAVTPVDTAHEDDLGDYYLAGTGDRAGRSSSTPRRHDRPTTSPPPASTDRLGGSGPLAQAPPPMGSRAGRAGASLERPYTPVERPIGNSRNHRSQGHEQEDP